MSRHATRRGFLAGVAASGSAIAAGSHAVGAAAGEPTRSRTALADAVREAVATALDDHDADGATVAVVEDGETVLREGFGHAYLNPDVPVDAESTLFRIGSVSKVLPFVAAMRLIDAGQIAAEDPITDHLDSVSVPDRDADDPITLRHLATHTAGFEQRSAGQVAVDPDEIRSLPDALTANDPARVHSPGEVPMYTNYNAGLAGQLVADVLDTEFAAAIRRTVFDPLGMAESTFEPLPAALVGEREDAAAAMNWYSEMPPASGMSSTATEMATLLHALVGNEPAGGEFLSAEAVAALAEQWHTPHDELAGASFGLERERRDGTLVVGHSGGVPSFSTDFRYLPESGVGLFVSVHGAEGNDARSAVTKAFLDHTAPVSEPERDDDGSPTDAGAITGRYRSMQATATASFEKALYGITESTTVVSIGDDGRLRTERRDETHRWIERSPRVFERADGAERLVFVAADDARTRLYRSSEPRAPVESVPLATQGRVHGPLALVAGLAVLSGVVGWPAAAGWRRYRARPAPDRSLSRGRWLAAAAAMTLFVFGFVGLYGVTQRWLYDRPPGFEFLFALPLIAAAFAALALGLVGRAWRRRQWDRGSRVHLSLVIAGVVVLCGLCWHWNLWGL